MIHPSAIVDPNAWLDSSVTVGPYSIIGPGVEIGAGCEIGPHAVLQGPMTMGQRNRVFQFATIGEGPQDKKYHGEPTRLEIGDDNVFRESCTMHRGTVGGGGITRIGNDNLFMASSHVAHDCKVANHSIFSNAASIAGHVEVEDHVILGGFTCVHQFCRIGRYGFCGLGTVVNQNIPPFVLASGNTAAAHGINKVGLRRAGFSSEEIQALHKAFRILLRRRGSRSEAIAQLAPLRDAMPVVAEFIGFIEISDRGIIR